MGTGESNAGGNPAMDWHPIQGGVEILLVASCYEGRTGGVCRTVHEQKKQRITDHGYQNFIFPNHGNKQVRYSF